MGQFGAGRRAVLKALAERQGITSDEQLDALDEGRSDVKLRVPISMRHALRESGLGGALAEVDILTVADPQEILATTAWADVEFEVDEIQFVAQNTTPITGEEDIAMFEKFIDMLNDLDDVQNIYHSAEV